MLNKLRPYQQDAAMCAISWIKKSTEPALLGLATGAGKSWIIAAISDWIVQKTGKKVLVLQPSTELVLQNFEKIKESNTRASIFSASANSKCTRHNVVYATPKTVLNSISRFGDAFACVIVDECHMTTPTIKQIIAHIAAKNPMLRVIGMTATPYRLGTGYIYQYDATGERISKLDTDETIDAYYHSLLYKINTRALIDMGFLTPAHTDTTALHYDTDNLTINKMGNFDAKQIEQAFEGQGRLTSQIVADVVQHSQGRKGVMLFASTVKHAQEILDSLPPDNSRMIGGDVNMAKAEREKLINDFKQQRFKYIVSVGTLTTGFDAPHVDVVAILRATESASLFQQIIGRGLRLHPDKTDCLVLDYAGNIERHKLQDDIFEPTIKTYKAKTSSTIEATCPSCNFSNDFAARDNPQKLDMDKQGFFLDLAGNRILLSVGANDAPVYMPAHLGRRCNGFVQSILNKGKLDRCEYRWAFKLCEKCNHENDIAARYCEKCKAELVDPNSSLKHEAARVKADPYAVFTEEVLFFSVKKGMSKAGNEMLVCDYSTPTTQFRAYYICDDSIALARKKWLGINKAVFGLDNVSTTVDDFIKQRTNQQPDTVTYQKNKTTGYFDVIGHNYPINEAII